MMKMLDKLKNRYEEAKFKVTTGSNLKIVDEPVDELVIRYKDYFFMIILDAESGEPTGDFGWSEGTPMTHVPIREHYTAVREESES